MFQSLDFIVTPCPEYCIYFPMLLNIHVQCDFIYTFIHSILFMKCPNVCNHLLLFDIKLFPVFSYYP